MMLRYAAALDICKRHAARLRWAMDHLRSRFPLTFETLAALDDTEIAILDQFTTRFAKLQDAMGANLFPAVLELTKEQGGLEAFLDKLHRLEKIGAIPSAEQWLLLREMRNQLAHDYPDDPVIQSASLNKVHALAKDLLAVLNHIELFAKKYT